MKLFITGCLHGEWDKLIDQVTSLIDEGNVIDMIIVTGDAQTMRDANDLLSFAAPEKYRLLGSFYKIYNGERKIPRPTIVVGGNHESSDYFHLLPFGGWLAPDVFYLGRACSLRIGDIIVSSISGLYKSTEYFLPVNEVYPIRSKNDLHTCYSLRAFSDFQLLGLPNTDIMLSHDWPSGIPMKYGGNYLSRRRNDLIESDKKGVFGLNKGFDIIKHLQPSAWFASHHHITFKATIENTSFMALPKPVRDDWFIVAEYEGDVGEIKFRGEWMSILKVTSEEMKDPNILKDVNWDERWEKVLKPKMEEMADTPVPPYNASPIEYTTAFCEQYGIYCPIKEIREYIKIE